MSSDESVDLNKNINNEIKSDVEVISETDQNFVKKRKKHVQFIDDEIDNEIDEEIVVHRNKKMKMGKNMNPKELLESVLFESDESVQDEKIEKKDEIIYNEKKNNDKEDQVDQYTKNILEKINFSDSERDDENKMDRLTNMNDRNYIKRGNERLIKNKSRQSIENRYDIDNNNMDSYKLAIDIFGDDFDINDIDFEKPFVNEDEKFDEEYVSDENEQDEYSDDYTGKKIINHHNIIKKSINELYEPEELKRQYLTDKDDEIRLKDIPERFQLRYNPVKSANDEELDEEANWIYENFFIKKSILLTTEKRLNNINSNIENYPIENVKYIKAALNLIRNELCEVPFILTYRHENINGIFNEDELWMIYRADNKWMSFIKQKNEFLLYLKNFKEFQMQYKFQDITNDFYYKISDRDFKYAKNIKLDQEFFDFNKKLQLYNNIYESEFLKYNISESIKILNYHKDPNMFNRHYFYISKGIDKVIKNIGLNSSNFDENVRVQYRKYNFEFPNISPIQLAEKYISSFYDSADKILEAVIEMYTIEISNEQHIKRYVYQIFLKNAKIDVNPTKKGLDEIDETHSYCSFKYILNKPLKTITSEMLLKLNQAKNDNLLNIEIKISELIKKEMLDYLKSFQNSTYDKSQYIKEWNDLCYKAIDKAILNYIIPLVTREIYQKLLNEAQEDLIDKCSKIFKNHLIYPPFSRELEKMKLDEKANFGESELPCILIINVPLINYNQQINKIQKHQIKSIKGNINLLSNYDNIKNNDNIENEFSISDCIDEIGYAIVMNSEFEMIEHVTINNNILKNFNNDDLSLKYSELSMKKIDKLVIKYNISDIFIPLLSKEYNYLSEKLEKRLINLNVSIQPQTHLINPYISNKVIKMMSLNKNWSLLKIEYEKTLSLGRYIIDPLIECVYLFSNDIKLDYLNDLIYPYQKYLNIDKLKESFEEKIVSMVNEIGIDINKICYINQYSELLQYICGLGPRKSIKIINDIRLYSDTLKLNNRTQLVTICNLGPKVFINCSGFIKILGSIDEEGNIDLLDTTRIHPELYDWARKIMIDALEIEDLNTKKYDYNDLLETLRLDSSKLKELDLDAFADELMKNGININKKYSLELISTEMLNEFPDYRPHYINLNNIEKFWILLNGGSRIDISETLEYISLKNSSNLMITRFHNEDLIPLYNGKLVSFVITNFIYKRPDKEDITKAIPFKDEETQIWKCPYCIELISHDLKKCWKHIENICPGRAIGIKGYIEGYFSTIFGIVSILNISDNPPQNIKERVKKGMHLTCQIINIKYDKFLIDLTCRSTDLLDKEYNCYKYKRDVHFNYDAENEQKKIDKNKLDKLKNQVIYMKKIIIHPSFKNVSFSDAENLLKTSEIGECIIRPSSKGIDHLTITWKVYDNIYQHIDIIEQDKPNQFSLGKKLWIKNEFYEDLDEIIARHISPMIILVKQVINLKVFNLADGGSRHKIAAILSDEKKRNPLRIPYIFSPCKIYPGKFLLGFLPRNTPIFEYVSITPDGVKFRDVIHNSFQDLISWFKNNFNKSNNVSTNNININLNKNSSHYIASPSTNFQKY